MKKKSILKHLFLQYCIVLSLSVRGQGYGLDSMVYVLQSAKEDTAQVNLLNEIISCFSCLEADKAILYSNKAIELSKKLNYQHGLGKTYHYLGNYYAFSKQLKNQSEAIKNHRQAEVILTSINDVEGLARLYWDMGIFQMTLDNYEEDLKLQLKSLEMWLKIGNQVQIANAYFRVGAEYVNLNRHLDAINYWSKAIKIFEDLGDERRLTGLYSEIASLHIEQGNYSQALQFLLASLKIFEQKAPFIGSYTLRLLGSVYSNLGNFKEATKYLNAALQNGRSAFDSSRIYNEIGKSYHRQGNYTLALKYLNLAVAKNNLPDDSTYLADDFHQIGRVYKDQARSLLGNDDNKDLVKTLLNSSIEKSAWALAYFEKAKARDGIAEASATLGIATARMASYSPGPAARLKYSEAIKILERSLELAKTIGLKKIQFEACSGLAETYQLLNDYKKAYEYNVKASIIKDSLISNESLNKLGELRIAYETEKAKAEEKLLQEKAKSEMQFGFSKREDSLKFEKVLAESRLQQQILVTKQGEQDLLLKQASLDLSNKQRELDKLAYLKTEAQLQAEQIRQIENEKKLSSAQQEKDLQESQLRLKQSELNLKENLIRSQKNETMFLMGGMVSLLLLSGTIFWNIRKRQQAEALIGKEKEKTEKANIAHKMAELELHGLRAQLNPHFMFNSLNAIQDLILREDSENSHLYLSRFSELLRILLDNANQPFIPLNKEIEFLQLYLALEKLRIPDLHYEIRVEDSINTESLYVPNMILQPYIENAIWHGLSHKKTDKALSIEIRQSNNLLNLSVKDNGIGRQKSSDLKKLYRNGHKSKGMELLSKRFNLLSKQFGADIHTAVKDLKTNDGDPAGTLVEIEVPISISEKAEYYLNDTNHNN